LKILVTGGAGYLGSTLVTLLLEAGNRVRVADCLLYGGQALGSFQHHPDFDFAYGDIRDRKFMRKSLDGIESVAHLAAIVGDPACAHDPTHARAVNLEASLGLWQECRRCRVERFVFASTCSNYGKMPGTEAYVDESSDLVPLSIYADTKAAFEKVLLGNDGAGPPGAISLRLATLYGVSPRMRFDLTVNEFTLDMLTKKHLVVFGEQFWRPYIHVRDAARAICEVLRAPPTDHPEVFNVGATDQNFRKLDIVERIRVHAPDAQVEYVCRKEDLRDYRVSFDKIAHQIGFRPSYVVEDGIAEIARLVKSGVTAWTNGVSL
jgi:nucleoside-diphosphate-sugar epimerase